MRVSEWSGGAGRYAAAYLAAGGRFGGGWRLPALGAAAGCPGRLSGPLAVSRLSGPLAVSGLSGPLAVSRLSGPLAVSRLSGPLAVSGRQQAGPPLPELVSDRVAPPGRLSAHTDSKCRQQDSLLGCRGATAADVSSAVLNAVWSASGPNGRQCIQRSSTSLLLILSELNPNDRSLFTSFLRPVPHPQICYPGLVDVVRRARGGPGVAPRSW